MSDRFDELADKVREINMALVMDDFATMEQADEQRKATAALLRAEFASLQADCERKDKALRWYADTNNYKKEYNTVVNPGGMGFIPVMADYGGTAREALTDAGKEEQHGS